MPARLRRAPSASAIRSSRGRPAARARVKRIVTYDGDLDMAFAPMSVTLALDDEIDISRGDIARRRPRSAADTSGSGSRPKSCGWTSGRSIPARVYLLKHTTRTVTAEVSHALVLNQIGTVTVSTARPLVFDRYEDNRATGSFILIDPATQFTAGAGMIVERGSRRPAAAVRARR